MSFQTHGLKKVAEVSSVPEVQEAPEISKEYTLEINPRNIPLLVGKGGFHLRNIVKFSTKKWYLEQEEQEKGDEKGDEKEDEKEDEGKKCPKVKIQFEQPPENKVIQVHLTSVDQFMIDTCEELIAVHVSKLEKTGKLVGNFEKSAQGPPTKKPFQRRMMQIFRVEMESRMIGKIIGKKGINCIKMKKFVVDQDSDQENAKNTKIFVKEQEKEFEKGMCIDLKDYGDGSGEYIIFMASVFTKNPYFTMRNVERAITNRLDNLHGSYTFDEDLSQRIEENEEKEESLSKQMFDEALEEEFGSVENNPSSW